MKSVKELKKLAPDVVVVVAFGQILSQEILDIPLDKKAILFVSDSIDNNRKGFEYLQATLNNLPRKDVVVCSVGRKSTDSGTTIDNIIELGEIYDQKLMNVAYSAADVFVIPSIMDNLPNTVLEALMCGTPVISFPVGGMLDMIEDGKNGNFADEISVGALAQAINQFFDKGVKWNTNEIRENAVAKFDLSVQVKNILQLYKNIPN
jgi:glycosyltransferase involved in cell wall biosynthesis